jgi:hypothetical protein
MKKYLILIAVLFLVGCATQPAPESAPAQPDDQGDMLAEKDAKIAELEGNLEELNTTIASLQEENATLRAEGGEVVVSTNAPYVCDDTIPNMKYSNPISAIAIIEGWFALQPEVAEMQGTYSTQFWQDVDSQIHTIRYIDAEDSLSKTATFLIFFEEAGWQEGLLYMSKQCWLDHPGD